MYMQAFKKIIIQVENQINKQRQSLESWLRIGEQGKNGYNNEFLNLKLYQHIIEQDNDATKKHAGISTLFFL